MQSKHKKIRVLLIEDNKDHAILQRNALEKHGSTYHVEDVDDGEKGYTLAMTGRFSIVLADYDLPHISGLDILRKIKSRRKYLPVVMVTSQGSERIAQEALRAGADDYVIKDETYLRNLDRIIRRTLEKAGTQRERLRLERMLKQRTRLLEKMNERLRAANQELKEVDQLKSDFISIVSHELRTPITSVKNAVHILLSEKTGDLGADQRKFLGLAERNLNRLTSLINSLLDLSMIEAGRTSFNYQSLPLEETVDAVVSALKPSAEKKSITIERDVAADVPLIQGDADKIERVVINLLHNAIKYTQMGGRNRVVVRKISAFELSMGKSTNIFLPETIDWVEIRIEDNGKGIAKEDRSKIFDRFRQY